MNAPAEQMQGAPRLPKRWPLVAQPSNRGESVLQDARLVNCFAEKDPNTGEWQVQKRIGFIRALNVGGSWVGGGAYNWGPANSAKNLFTVWGLGLTSAIYKDGGILGAASLDRINPGQKFTFTETQGTTRYLIFAGPNNLYYTSGAGYTQATLQAGRGTFIRGVGYLDGTIYYMDELCNIWGSTIDDPTTNPWPGSNKVIANSIPGDGVALVQLLTYVIALKTNSREVFYDAGNPTGSPLSPIAGALSNYGCADLGSVQVIDNILFYMSSNKTVSPQLIRVEGLNERIVSPPPVERLIDAAQQTSTAGNIFSWAFKHGGHRFYGATIQSLNLTIVYDIDQNLYYQWTGNPAVGLTFFPLVSMAYTTTLLHAAQGFGDGNIYLFEGDYVYPTDNGVVSPVDIVTPNTDFGTRRRKVLNRMYIRSDQTLGSTLYMRRSDNDYKNWSNFRKLDLGRNAPYFDNEGTFVKRAYHFRHASPTAFRIRSADLDMRIGTV